jgi:hypothetical protein
MRTTLNDVIRFHASADTGPAFAAHLQGRVNRLDG